MNRHLHIVTHHIPGAEDTSLGSDTVHTIRACTAAGIEVHLHCFQHRYEEQTVPEDLCHTVCYYKRNTGQRGMEWFLPYGVSSRSSPALIEALNQDEHPVLFVGLFSVHPLLQTQFNKNRKILVRFNRLESRYYADLAKITPSGIRKFSYTLERLRCRLLEKKIIQSHTIVASSQSLLDRIEHKSKHHSVSVVPEFRGVSMAHFEEGNGGFCLFQGNFAERENEYAAHWLLEHVFNTVDIPLVIAGNSPSTTLEQAAHLRMHTCLVANPSEKELMDLIKKAQVNLFPTFVSSESQLGMLKSLSLGRHVLTNPKAVRENNLANVCEVAADPETFCQAIRILFEKEYTAAQKKLREASLSTQFRDSENLHHLLNMLY